MTTEIRTSVCKFKIENKEGEWDVLGKESRKKMKIIGYIKITTPDMTMQYSS